jgi:hypothetical protein
MIRWPRIKGFVEVRVCWAQGSGLEHGRRREECIVLDWGGIIEVLRWDDGE